MYKNLLYKKPLPLLLPSIFDLVRFLFECRFNISIYDYPTTNCV